MIFYTKKPLDKDNLIIYYFNGQEIKQGDICKINSIPTTFGDEILINEIKIIEIKNQAFGVNLYDIIIEATCIGIINTPFNLLELQDVEAVLSLNGKELVINNIKPLLRYKTWKEELNRMLDTVKIPKMGKIPHRNSLKKLLKES